jgi:hypothetical protein
MPGSKFSRSYGFACRLLIDMFDSKHGGLLAYVLKKTAPENADGVVDIWSTWRILNML